MSNKNHNIKQKPFLKIFIIPLWAVQQIPYVFPTAFKSKSKLQNKKIQNSQIKFTETNWTIPKKREKWGFVYRWQSPLVQQSPKLLFLLAPLSISFLFFNFLLSYSLFLFQKPLLPSPFTAEFGHQSTDPFPSHTSIIFTCFLFSLSFSFDAGVVSLPKPTRSIIHHRQSFTVPTPLLLRVLSSSSISISIDKRKKIKNPYRTMTFWRRPFQGALKEMKGEKGLHLSFYGLWHVLILIFAFFWK